MNKSFLILLVFLFFICNVYAASIINSCRTVYTPGEYILNQSITSTTTCLTVNASNVNIDCNGSAIYYGSDGANGRIGINAVLSTVDLTNLTIRNCTIVDTNALGTTGYGIFLSRFSNSNIYNNTIQTNGTSSNHGIYLTTGCEKNYIENNTIKALGTTTGNIGIYLLSQSNENIIRSNTVIANGTTTSYSILVSTSDNNRISNNSFITYSKTATGNTDGHTVYLYFGSRNNTIENNYISGRSAARNYMIQLNGNCNYNTIGNNTIIANGSEGSNWGIYVYSGDFNNISNNDIKTNGTSANYGIYLGSASSYNSLKDNNISTWGTTTNNYGIYLVSALSSNITNNTIKTNGLSTGNIGIALSNSPRNDIRNNTISANGTTTAYGIYLAGSHLNYIASNSINTYGSAATTNGYGIFLTGSDFATIINNTVKTFGLSTGNAGVYLTYSTNNNISNNDIKTNGTSSGNVGVYLYLSTQYNTVYNNTISANGTTTNYGVSVYLASNNTIESNKISTWGTSTTNHGVFLTTSANGNNVYYNNISTYGTTTDHGISLSASDRNIIVGNYILANGSTTASGTTTSNYGISLTTNCYDNEMYNNTMYSYGGRYNYGLSLLANSRDNIMQGNIVYTNGTGALNAGAYISESYYNDILNNTFFTTGSNANYGVYLLSNARYNLIKSNNINTSGSTDSYGIYLAATDPNYPNNNTFDSNNFLRVAGTEFRVGNAYIDDIWLVNQNLSNYVFTGVGSTVVVRNDTYGEIKFLQRLTGTGTNFSNQIHVKENYAFVDGSVSGLNKSAEITIYNRSTTSNELQILRDGVLCPSDRCINLTSMQAGNVTFNVTGWSYYSIRAVSKNPALNLNLPGNYFNTTSQNVSFNFTATDDISDILSCNLYIDSSLNNSNSSVKNDSLTNLLVVNLERTNHSWYVQCFDGANNSNTSETRTFNVTTPRPSVTYNYPSNNSFFDNISSMELNYTANENDLYNTTVWLYGNEGLLNTSYNVSNGTTLTYNWTGLNLGQYNWTVIASNNIANSSREYNYFNVTNLTLNCEAGGPYQQSALVLAQGNVSDGVSSLVSQPINVYVYNSGILISAKSLNSVGSGLFQTTFSNISTGVNTLNVSSTYQGYTKYCLDEFIVESAASLVMDKIISVSNISNESIDYNITLRLVNKGGSNASYSNITDNDYPSSPYIIGTIAAGSYAERSYIRAFNRNASNYNVSLSVASGDAVDSYSGSVVSANSSAITVIVPATTANTNISVIKNIQFLSENETSVVYSLTSTFINSGGSDLTGIAVKDSDLSLSTSIDLNRTQSYSSSGTKIISKLVYSKNYSFFKANASFNGIVYESNQINVLVPALESNSSLLLSKTASYYALSDYNVTYNISLTVTNSGGRNISNVSIYDSNYSGSSFSIGNLTAGESSNVSYLMNFTRQTSAYTQSLSIATANGTDTLYLNEVEISSNQVEVLVPALASASAASLVMDKIISVSNISNESIDYNITLRLTNKGGSNASYSNITDSNYPSSPYVIGTITAGSYAERSYIRAFNRNASNYNVSLSVASGDAVDSYAGSVVSANSSAITVIVPVQEEGQQLTLVKNAYYNSENATAINYTVSLEMVNSGGIDLTAITVLDSDLSLNTLIDLNVSGYYNYSSSVLIDKAASNTNKLFVKSTATVNTITYESNQINVRIPGYGGPADVTVYAPDSVSASSSFNSNIEVENQNPDIGQDFTIDYWITSNDEATNYSSGQKTIYVAASSSTNTTIALTSPASAGTYRLKSLVTWTGGTATAFDSFTVTSTSSNVTETPVTSTGGGGGGGGKPKCGDGYDNDGDGLIDLNDPGCKDKNDYDETNVVEEVPISGQTVRTKPELLDVLTDVLEDYKIVTPGSKVLMEITLYNLGTEEVIDAVINYCIKTSSGEVIKCSEETVAVYTKIQLIKEFLLPEEIKEGKYYIYSNIEYNGQKSYYETSFVVKSSPKENIFVYTKKLFIVNLSLITKSIYPLLLIFLALIVILIIILNIKRRPYNKKVDNNNVLGIKGKKVYTEDGNYIGKVKEICFKGEKPVIYGWLIKPDKRIYKNLKEKNILIKHGHVKSIGHAMIVDKSIFEGLVKYIRK